MRTVPGHYTMRRLGFVSLVVGALAVVALLLAGPMPPLRAKKPATSTGRPARAAGQGQASAGPQLNVQVNLVDVFVTVRDKRTRQIISDLNQDDFRIFEDGQEQKVAFFSKDSKLPVTMGLLLDTSLSEQYTLGSEQDAALAFFQRVLRKGDLAMIMTFDSDADLLADFTDSQPALSRAIRRAQINNPGEPGPFNPSRLAGTVFYDAIYLACHEKLASEAGRKALVILTDAHDEGSKLKIQDAIEAAQRTDTVVHILLIGDPEHFSVDEGSSKKLTDETGGRTIVVHNQRNLQQAFDQISEELRSQYTVGYYSTNAARDGSYRKIKIDVTRKGAEALARRGYYASKEKE